MKRMVDMRTITIDNTLYQDAETIAKRRNSSVQALVEAFLRKLRSEATEGTETAEEKIAKYEVSNFTKSQQVGGGHHVPANENDIEGRIDFKGSDSISDDYKSELSEKKSKTKDFKVSDQVRSLLGRLSIPGHDIDWEKEKDAYFMSKYGL